ncbi:RNA polymerase II elongation factor Ell [Nylanderia fulva]|uniref:RNA polymerase II elongation factor Ell n=1 Tax=Nylanderia fulva TaxID=613905 RepID=UPI0010FAD927|nr:RNA polymerase II elongation factor Ell [Nylanderia fulva]
MAGRVERHYRKLSIPSSHGLIGFTFSLSSNQDIEGPQGGFECVRQTGPKSLESLGAIPCKMRIQANDDVYETTRHRMAVAEENNKNKCTRVIKANGPDIGRKVKVKIPGRTIQLPSSYAKHRESTTSIPTSGSSQPRASTNKPATASKSSSKSNHLAATHNPDKKISDIMRRPLKERLIHYLALRDYKKPELYDRIKKEGLREKERPIMTTILKQVSYMRDNTYILHRWIWNDVQEDWPFFTEQERTILRRRKPQNLTPPGSSDGSSGSGQSPNSIHAGSPPAITAPPPSLLNNKRPGYYQGNDGLPTKKPRISHYKRLEPISFIPAGEKISNSSSYNNNNSGVSATVSGAVGGNSSSGSNSAGGGSTNSSNGGSQLDGCESRQQRERSRADYRTERTANSDVLRGAGNGYGGALAVPSSSSRPSYLTSSPSDSERNSHHQSGGHGRDGNVAAIGGNAGSNTNDVGSTNRKDRSDRSERSRDAREERNRERECRNRSSVVNDASNLSTSLVRSEASSSNAHICNDNASSIEMTISPPTDAELERLGSPGEYPDYLTYYTTISSTKQKRRYKEEFYANYDEYRVLHSKITKTAERFRYLQNQLEKHKASGSVSEQEATSKQIVREYNETKQNREYQQLKKRFEYLHEKLSHIKQLIIDYETTISAANNVDSSIVSTTSASVNVEDLDSRHY